MWLLAAHVALWWVEPLHLLGLTTCEGMVDMVHDACTCRYECVLTGQLASITLQDRLVGLIGAVEGIVVGSDRDEASTACACTAADDTW
jgi:hypothetical protein